VAQPSITSRFHQRSPYRVTMNEAFAEVIDGCATGREEGTWITFEVKRAWLRLYESGHAHSVEVWDEHKLVVAQPSITSAKASFIVTR
jgi:leucyl/phenylalanyl-tRNA--protein transferase